MNILTLCGSLRARSSNRALLRAFERLAPSTLTFCHYERINELPHFNPELDRSVVPDEVQALRKLVASARAVIVSTPEYAHALPGSFKNALDWLVSDPGFVGKRVVVLHVSRGSTWALDSLHEVLRTMSAIIIKPASVSLSLGSNQVNENDILMRDDHREVLAGSIDHLISELEGLESGRQD